MAKTVVGSFDSFDEAQRVVSQLSSMGVGSKDVSLVANDAGGTYSSRVGSGTAATGTTVRTDPAVDTDAVAHTTGGDIASGAVTGTVIGGTAGLIAGLAGLAVPGVGPLVAAGPIAAALAGAGVGAVAGGLIGGLRHVGVDETDAEYYAESVRRGGALVTVRAEDSRANEIADLMRQHGAVDIQGRVAQWKQSGWSRFDEAAQPYSTTDIERERSTYRSMGGTAGTTSTAYAGSTVGAPMTGETVRTDNRSTMQRASDAIERAVPGDSDRDGK